MGYSVALVQQLSDLRTRLEGVAELDISDPAKAVKLGTKLLELDQSHSGSWFGDHARTYFDGFKAPPDGKTFDVEWGFVGGYGIRRNVGWRVYTIDEINRFIFDGIGEGLNDELVALSEKITSEVEKHKSQMLDLIDFLESKLDKRVIERYRSSVQEANLASIGTIVNAALKNAPRMTRDSSEITKGQTVPQHVRFDAILRVCTKNKRVAAQLSRVAGNLEELLQLQYSTGTMPGTRRIFIGHGRSLVWRELKDFLTERLGLTYEEFNRVSAAGVGTQERLSEALDQCSFAFVVLTAEDEQSDGSFRARENAVHEVGLCQGRYGFRRGIVVLESGCNEFSNIAGLGQVRFERANIRSCFEEIRMVLEREGLISASSGKSPN